MGKPRQNQAPADQQTDTLALEDQSISTNLAATAVPLSLGEVKTTLLFITPIYGLNVTKQKSGSGKGGK